MSDFFASWNRNKRGVAINVKSEEGREVCRRLVTRADVFVEGSRLGTMDRLGTGWEATNKNREWQRRVAAGHTPGLW